MRLRNDDRAAAALGDATVTRGGGWGLAQVQNLAPVLTHDMSSRRHPQVEAIVRLLGYLPSERAMRALFDHMDADRSEEVPSRSLPFSRARAGARSVRRDRDRPSFRFVHEAPRSTREGSKGAALDTRGRPAVGLTRPRPGSARGGLSVGL